MGDLSLPMATTARLRACNAVTPICRPCCTHRRSVGGLRCRGAVFVATKKNLERDFSRTCIQDFCSVGELLPIPTVDRKEAVTSERKKLFLMLYQPAVILNSLGIPKSAAK